VLLFNYVDQPGGAADGNNRWSWRGLNATRDHNVQIIDMFNDDAGGIYSNNYAVNS
jgi:hypothetical protein